MADKVTDTFDLVRLFPDFWLKSPQTQEQWARDTRGRVDTRSLDYLNLITTNGYCLGSQGSVCASYFGLPMFVPAGSMDSLTILQHGCLPELLQGQMLLARLVKPNELVVDFGARSGFTSLLLAASLQGRGVIHAFEPTGPALWCAMANRYLDINTLMIKVHDLGDIDLTASGASVLASELQAYALTPDWIFCHQTTLNVAMLNMAYNLRTTGTKFLLRVDTTPAGCIGTLRALLDELKQHYTLFKFDTEFRNITWLVMI